MGCSDLVIADDNFIATLKTNYRQMLGVEMEGYGAAYAVNKAGLGIKFILIKCVCDMAGEAKDSKYQKYCSYMSASFARQLIIENVFE